MFSFFFFNDTATTEIYTLSLHDALPILAAVRTARAERRSSSRRARRSRSHESARASTQPTTTAMIASTMRDRKSTRPELQSRQYLVCRLLLEKKKINTQHLSQMIT